MSGPDIVMTVFSVLIAGWLSFFGYVAAQWFTSGTRPEDGCMATFIAIMGAGCLFILSLFALMMAGA